MTTYRQMCDNENMTNTIDRRRPRNNTEAKAALNIRRGTGQARTVDWFHINRNRDAMTGAQHYDINVKPGNTMRINVFSGIPFLHVRSGHVEIAFMSSWGNSVTIHEGASAHVIVHDADTKVTITNEGGEYTMDIPEGRNRVYFPGKYDDAKPF